MARNEDLRRLLSLAGVCQQEEQVEAGLNSVSRLGPHGAFLFLSLKNPVGPLGSAPPQQLHPEEAVVLEAGGQPEDSPQLLC